MRGKTGMYRIMQLGNWYLCAEQECHYMCSGGAFIGFCGIGFVACFAIE